MDSRIKYIIVGLVVFIVLSGIFIPLITFAQYFSDLGNKERIINHKKSGLVLLDRDGNPFFTFYQAKTDTYVPLSAIAPSVQRAVVASEDKEFYTHSGFSLRGIVRAAYVNIINQEISQGGSTITQELVKNLLLSSDKSFIRKYRELFLALELNRRYSKDDILEMYLNSVYFGEGAFGVEDAAQTYFGIHASQLSTAQSALLVALLPAPSSLSPLSNSIEETIKRQHIVLQEMVEEGYLTGKEAEDAKNQKLVFKPKQEDINTLAPHFALYVRDLLIQNTVRRKLSVQDIP